MPDDELPAARYRRLAVECLELAYTFSAGDQRTAAFEAALSKLGLVDRQDPLTMTVAKLVMQLAKDGESDPKQLCDEALKVSANDQNPTLHRVRWGWRLEQINTGTFKSARGSQSPSPAGSSSHTALLEMAEVWERLAKECRKGLGQRPTTDRELRAATAFVRVRSRRPELANPNPPPP